MTGASPYPDKDHRPTDARGTAILPDDLYASPPPWDIGRPQPAFLALVDEGHVTGRVLDAGCGTGQHTLMAAGLRIDALEPATIDITTDPAGVRAWLLAITRI
jgi:hypothetical protein